MTAPRSAALKVAAMYWVLLVFGMALYTTIRRDDFATLSPVWSGTIIGTALGQLLAARSYRAWLVVLAIVVVGAFWISQLPEDVSSYVVWVAYLPAALCGFWSLGDRTSLLAFWFPTVIWMLSILDGADANAIPDAAGLVELGGLAVLFIVFLRVREERRLALWRTISPMQLAVVKPPVVVHAITHAPRLVWSVVASALGLATTLWLAPKLWHVETFDGDPVAREAAQEGVPCCPLTEVTPKHVRTKEYFSFGRSHEQLGSPATSTGCRVCTADPALVASGGGITTAGPAIYGPATPPRPTASVAYVPEGDVVIAPVGGAITPPPNVDSPQAPVATPAPVVAPPPPTAPTTATTTIETAPVIEKPSAKQAIAQPRATGAPPVLRAPSTAGEVALKWAELLCSALLAGQLFALALRPLRRWLALRHFARPFWDETVDQRVSNAWQLALVGLRDAGWRTSSAEAPAMLAKRVKIEGLDRCATILERARHGIAIDRGDLSEMAANAQLAYRRARAHASWLARSLAWLRWPVA